MIYLAFALVTLSFILAVKSNLDKEDIEAKLLDVCRANDAVVARIIKLNAETKEVMNCVADLANRVSKVAKIVVKKV